jgi:[protein-PII] uridylyltransferase
MARELKIADSLEEARKAFVESFMKGEGQGEISSAYSRNIDKMISSAAELLISDGLRSGAIAIVALGGYGRREMALYSDVDLLLLHEEDMGDERLRDIIEPLMHPSWDAGLEMSCSVRTPSDCARIMEKDAKALTAMLDARLIYGSPKLIEALSSSIEKFFLKKFNVDAFIKAKRVERRERLSKYGDKIFLTQPNVKESEGGLRDFDTLRWIARVAAQAKSSDEALAHAVPNANSRRELLDSVEYLWRLRNALHIHSHRRNDALAEDVQGEVAGMLRYLDDHAMSAAEKMMSRYYECAKNIHLSSSRAIDIIERRRSPPTMFGRLVVRRTLSEGIERTEFNTVSVEESHLANDPSVALKAFHLSQIMGIPIDAHSKELFSHHRHMGGDAFTSDESRATLRKMFSKIESLDRVLYEMYECGYLEKCLPEMSHVLYHIEHDGFHIYTTGSHSIKAIAVLAMLMRDGTIPGHRHLKSVLKDIKRVHVLTLAVLLHDVGKAMGGSHSEKGARIARDVAIRLGFSEADADDVEFLVGSHLQMAKIALRRDISDPALIERFAQSFTSGELLSMLYLLTYADIGAIAPNMWNTWKAGLLSKLYDKTKEAFISEHKTPSAHRRADEKKKKEIKKFLQPAISDGEIEAHLLTVPERYLHSLPADTIASHIAMATSGHTAPVGMSFREIPERVCTEFSIMTKDRRGLFATITGVLSAGGADILDALVFTTRRGLAIDVFWVTDASGKPFSDQARMDKIKSEMSEVIEGKRDFDSSIAKRLASGILDAVKRDFRDEIDIENDVSPTETVVEIRTRDRRGLLYRISSAFHAMDLTIDRAIVSTHVDRVIDVFYIRRADGTKVPDGRDVGELKTKILEALER